MLNSDYFPQAGPQMSTEQFLCDVGTWLWRLQRDLDAVAVPETATALKPARRDLEYLRSVLRACGVEVIDHGGQPVPSTGAPSYRIVGYEERPAAGGSCILETVLPEVRIAGRVVQRAEVIASRDAVAPAADRPDADAGPDAAHTEEA